MKKNFKRTLAFLLTFTMVISCLIVNFSLVTSADATEQPVLLYDFESGIGNVAVQTSAWGAVAHETRGLYAKSGNSLQVKILKDGQATNSKVQNIYMPYTHTAGYNGISFWMQNTQGNPDFDIYVENLETNQKVLLLSVSIPVGTTKEITALYPDEFVPSQTASKNRIVLSAILASSGNSYSYVDEVYEIKGDPDAPAKIYDFDGLTALPSDIGFGNQYRTAIALNTDSTNAKSGKSLKIGTVVTSGASLEDYAYVRYTHTPDRNGVALWVKAETAITFTPKLKNSDTAQVKTFPAISLAAGETREITLLYTDSTGTFTPSAKAGKNTLYFYHKTESSSTKAYYVDDICEIKNPDQAVEVTKTIADFDDGDTSNALTGTTGYSSSTGAAPTFTAVVDPRGATGKSLKVTIPTATNVNNVHSYTAFEYTGATGYDGISFWIKADTYIKMEIRIQRGAQTHYALGSRIEMSAGTSKEVHVRYEDIKEAVSLNANQGNIIPQPYSFEGGPLYVKFYILASTSAEKGFTLDDIKQFKELADDTEESTGKVIENFANGGTGSVTAGGEAAPTFTSVADPRDPNGYALKATIPASVANNHSRLYLGEYTGPSNYLGVSFWIKAETDLTFELRILRGSLWYYTLRRVTLKAGEAQKVTALYSDFREPVSLNASIGSLVPDTANKVYEGYPLTLEIYGLSNGTSEKSYIIDDIEHFNPAFSGASLSLSDDIGLNYKVDPADLAGHTDASVVFTQGETEQTVTEPTTDAKGRYVYRFDNIDPSKMNDTITATLKYGDNVVLTKEYSVADYCYTMMWKAPGNEKLCNLLADILEYGAKAQLYIENNIESLATANLAASYKEWIGREPATLTGVTEVITKTTSVETPSASWKAVGLYLDDAINIKLTLQTDLDVANIKAKVTSTGMSPITIQGTSFEVLGNGKYSFLIEDVDASHVRDVFKVVLYDDGDTPISNTVNYSIETYAKAKIEGSNAALADLMKALIKYGDSVKTYIA